MIANDDKRSQYLSDLADVRGVPLAELSERSWPTRVAEPLDAQVPAAMFNSAI
jgi:hypothetical protein